MPKIRRIELEWKKLFAFEQVESNHRDSRVISQVGEKVGGKPVVRLGPKIGDKIGEKAP